MQKTASPFGLLYQKKESQKTKKAAEPLRGKQRRKPKNGNQKAHQGAPQIKRLTPPGEKMMRKTRMEVTECKNSFAIRIYCIKNGKEISNMKNNKN